MNELPDPLVQLEESIRAAQSYVVASDNLRPRVLEAASQRATLTRGWWRMLQISVGLLVCGVISVPVGRHLERWRTHVAAPSAQQMAERAEKFAQQPQVGQSWALYEAFNELRESTAAKMHQR